MPPAMMAARMNNCGETLDFDLTALRSGFQFPTQRILLDRATIDAYLAAVGETDALYAGEAASVPPVAIMALSMRGLAGLLAARPGALHVSQRIAARQAVPVGVEVATSLTVRNRSERRGTVALNLEVEVLLEGRMVQEGAILLMIPLTETGVSHG